MYFALKHLHLVLIASAVLMFMLRFYWVQTGSGRAYSGQIMKVSGWLNGLVVLSGCAHSGIVNTATYAREVTGVDRIFAVMGGFHLTGADFEPIIGRTTEALKALKPRYIVPTHCTGRRASMHAHSAAPTM